MSQMRHIFLASVLVAAAVSSAGAVTFENMMRRMTFHVTAPCDGGDTVYRVTHNGPTGPNNTPWQIHTWTTVPIDIHAIHMVKFAGGPHQWFMIGQNGPSGDASLYLDSTQQSNIWYFPHATPFPAVSGDNPLYYFDLHGVCTGGTPMQAFITFLYSYASETPDPPPPPPPPPPVCSTYNALNQSDKSARITLSNGNLRATGDGTSNHALVRAISALTEDAYFEITMAGQGSTISGPPVNILGVQAAAASVNAPVGSAAPGFGLGYNAGYGNFYNSGFTRTGNPVPLANVTFGIAYKHATREIWIRNAAGWLSGDPVTGVSPTAVTADQSPLFPAVSLYGANSGTATFNFGASAFAYTPPAGFKAGVCQ